MKIISALKSNHKEGKDLDSDIIIFLTGDRKVAEIEKLEKHQWIYSI